MRTDSTLFKVAAAALAAFAVYALIDFLFSGLAPAVGTAAAVLIAWFILKR